MKTGKVNYFAVNTWLEPHIGHLYDVLKVNGKRVLLDVYNGVVKPVWADKELIDLGNETE